MKFFSSLKTLIPVANSKNMIFCFVLSATSLASYSAYADTNTYRASYRVSISGFSVAHMSLTTKITDDKYETVGSVSPSGLASIISSTKGETKVNGQIINGKFQTSDFLVNYKSGKDKGRIEIKFKDGNVISSKVSPNKKKKAKDWIAIEKGHLQAVLDPATALTFPVGGNVCARTLPIYVGVTRVDLKLTHKSVRPFRVGKYFDYTYVCSVQFIPRSGYRKNDKLVDYYVNTKNMEIWFGKTNKGRHYAPVKIKVPTKIGTAMVWATHFEK